MREDKASVIGHTYTFEHIYAKAHQVDTVRTEVHMPHEVVPASNFHHRIDKVEAAHLARVERPADVVQLPNSLVR